MKKMTAFLAAIAVMGMGSVAMAEEDPYLLPPPQSTLSMTVVGYTTTPVNYSGAPVGGGIDGVFGMAAYSGTLDGEYQPTGSGVAISGGADLTLNGEDQVGCGNGCDEGFLDGNTAAMSLAASGAAGYGLDSEDNQVVYATNASTAIVSGSENLSGFAGIGASAAASNGNYGAHVGGLLSGIPYHPEVP
ncbi:MAG: hypothetical protein MI684_04910 [Chlorobiales bacterium]|nr:hypothetical protein [Chlorobiales bacterium]